jgi:hypothetical protein
MKRLLLVTLLVAGCETSPVWYATHPNKQTITVDGYQVNVVPRGINEYDALGGDDGVRTNMPTLKARQIRAVEIASKCKVAAAEYMPSSGVLQTVVRCD